MMTGTPMALRPQSIHPQQRTALPRWSRVLASVAVAVTLFGSAPSASSAEIFTLNYIKIEHEVYVIVCDDNDRLLANCTEEWVQECSNSEGRARVYLEGDGECELQSDDHKGWVPVLSPSGPVE